MKAVSVTLQPQRERPSVGRLLRRATPVWVLLAVLIASQLASYWWPKSLQDVLVGPVATIQYIVSDPQEMWQATAATFIEAFAGYVTGNLVGLMIGTSCHLFRRFGRAVFPLLVVAQAVPVITFSAIVVLWFGNTLSARAFLAAYLAFFPMTLNVYRALGDVKPEMVTVLQAFGAGRLFMLRTAELPAILPAVLTALKVSAVLAVSGAIVGELFGATHGLGVMLLSGLYYLSGAQLWASIVLSGAMSLVGFGLIALLERRLSWWSE